MAHGAKEFRGFQPSAGKHALFYVETGGLWKYAQVSAYRRLWFVRATPIRDGFPRRGARASRTG